MQCQVKCTEAWFRKGVCYKWDSFISHTSMQKLLFPLWNSFKNRSLKAKIGLLFLIFFSFFLVSMAFSLIYPRSWIFLDNVRLYFQRNIISTISDWRYSYQIDTIADTATLLSAKRLAPWDLIFTSENSTLWSAFIDGERKHVLMYLGTMKQLQHLLSTNSWLYQQIQALWFSSTTPLIIEARFDGVKIKPLSELPDTESLTVLRLTLPKKKIKTWLELLTWSLWKAYDFDFNTQNDESLYCSELFLEVLKERGFTPLVDEGILRDVISPSELIRALLIYPSDKRGVRMLFYLKMKEGNLYYESLPALLAQL